LKNSIEGSDDCNYTQKEVEIYEQQEIEAILAACRRPYFKMVLLVLYMTGMRMKEAMHVNG
jgi:integrase